MKHESSNSFAWFDDDTLWIDDAYGTTVVTFGKKSVKVKTSVRPTKCLVGIHPSPLSYEDRALPGEASPRVGSTLTGPKHTVFVPVLGEDLWIEATGAWVPRGLNIAFPALRAPLRAAAEKVARLSIGQPITVFLSELSCTNAYSFRWGASGWPQTVQDLVLASVWEAVSWFESIRHIPNTPFGGHGGRLLPPGEHEATLDAEALGALLDRFDAAKLPVKSALAGLLRAQVRPVLTEPAARLLLDRIAAQEGLEAGLSPAAIVEARANVWYVANDYESARWIEKVGDLV